MSGDIPADRLGDRKLTSAERHEYRNRALFEKAAAEGYFRLASLDEWAIDAGLPFLFSRALPWDGEGESQAENMQLIHYSLLFLRIGNYFAANANDVAIKHYAKRFGEDRHHSKNAAALAMNVEITDRVLNAVFDGNLVMCDPAGFPTDVTVNRLAYEECPERFLRDADVRQLLGLYSADITKGDSDAPASDSKKPALLASPEIRWVFRNVRSRTRHGHNYEKLSQDQWISRLKDPPKWLEHARLLRGNAGKSDPIWDPVLVAIALRVQGALWTELDEAFEVETLSPWQERWRKETKNRK